MNKKNNRKGFTTVELVIVIAVIAILAAVMIPVFSGLISDAQESAALQEARGLYTQYLNEFDYTTGGTPVTNGYIVVDGHTILIENGEATVVEGTTDPSTPTIPVA